MSIFYLLLFLVLFPFSCFFTCKTKIICIYIFLLITYLGLIYIFPYYTKDNIYGEAWIALGFIILYYGIAFVIQLLLYLLTWKEHSKEIIIISITPYVIVGITFLVFRNQIPF